MLTQFSSWLLSECSLRVIEIGTLKGNTFNTKKINGNTYCANRANKFNVEMSGWVLLNYKIIEKKFQSENVQSLVCNEKSAVGAHEIQNWNFTLRIGGRLKDAIHFAHGYQIDLIFCMKPDVQIVWTRKSILLLTEILPFNIFFWENFFRCQNCTNERNFHDFLRFDSQNVGAPPSRFFSENTTLEMFSMHLFGMKPWW